jgi:pimeloyl-ACP methyl ester carboxylesterase/DNA-binding SARP family transcriptional activator
LNGCTHMIHVRVLGSAELTDSGGAELTAVLAQPKRFALLVYLAMSPGYHRRDTLLALFWPELDTRRARGSLNQAIGFLRRELGGSPESVIISRGAAELGIDSSALWCDIASFRQHVHAQHFGEALDLYRGDLLPGFHGVPETEFEEWLGTERAQLRTSAVRAAREVARASEQASHYTTAVTSARRAVDLSGLDERAVRDLLTLLDRLGDRAGAMTAYEEFGERLAKELDAEPSAETRALVTQIRRRAEIPENSIEPAQLGPGVELNGWRVIRELGRGGMATVHLALDVKHDRHVAIKELRPELATRVTAEPFLREIQIMARLAHPHILPLIDSGARRGRPYLVAPYVAGESLRARLSREHQLPLEESLRLTMEIAQALDYAHRRGVIHCDIKPENILLADGHAVVADFGIARAIHASGTGGSDDLPERPAIGSPPYMSPELLQGAPIRVQTDIYSLGCVMIEMLTGTLPRDGKLPQGFQRFGPGVARLAAECVAQESNQRPRSAADVIRRLERIARPVPEGEAPKIETDATSVVRWRVQRDAAWITLLTLAAIALPLIIKSVQTTAPAAPSDSTASLIQLQDEPFVVGWTRAGGVLAWADYRFGLDRNVVHGGASSGHITARSLAPKAPFATLMQTIRADDYRGKRIRLAAYVKSRGVAKEAVGLWLRVEGEGGSLGFHSTARGKLTTNGRTQPPDSTRHSTDWTLQSVVLDVPTNAIGIAFGLTLSLTGEAWIDDASLEVVNAGVPVTSRRLQPTANARELTRQRKYYDAMPLAPVNLRLEPMARPRDATFFGFDLTRIHYTIAGNGPDTVLVLGAAFMRDDLAPLLPGRTLILLDGRGRGHSESPLDSTNYGVAWEVPDIEQMRLRLGISRMHLIAWSTDGAMAAAYAKKYPVRVKSLVQIAPIAPHWDIARPDTRQRKPVVDSAALPRIAALQTSMRTREDSLTYCRLNVRARLLYPLMVDTSALARMRTDVCFAPNEWPGRIDQTDRLTRTALGKHYDFRADAAAVQAPVLVVWPDADLVPLSGAREWRQSFQDARLLTIPAAGHLPWLERPEVFFPALDQFLRASWPAAAR